LLGAAAGVSPPSSDKSSPVRASAKVERRDDGADETEIGLCTPVISLMGMTSMTSAPLDEAKTTSLEV
jgi:hypothetical protein